MTQKKLTWLMVITLAIGSSMIYGAAPSTVVKGKNEQRVEIKAPIINLGVAASGNIRTQVSIGSIHQGSTVDGGNTQTIFLGADESGDFSILNMGASSGGQTTCANVMIGSIGSSSCMK